MPYADSRGTRIHYTIEGLEDAPVLVLLRGLARSSRYWLDFRELLARRYRVVLIDNRGVERSDSPRPPYTTATMADDAAAVLDHAAIERAHVFGISLGGMIAQELALRHPDRVDKLVLAATTPGGRKARSTPLRSVYVLLRGGTMPFDRAIHYTASVVLAPAFAQERGDILQTWIDLATSEPPPFRGLLGQFLAAARHDAWDRLHHIAHSTLVITGDEDRLIPSQNSYLLLSRLKDARLHIVDGGGHDFVTELPEQTTRVVSTFLDR